MSGNSPALISQDEHTRMQKLEVKALASMLCELEDLKRKRIDRSVYPELPPIRNKWPESLLLIHMRPGHLGSITRRPVSGITDMIWWIGIVLLLSRRINYALWLESRCRRGKGRVWSKWGASLEPGKFFRTAGQNRTTLIEKPKEIQCRKGKRNEL